MFVFDVGLQIVCYFFIKTFKSWYTFHEEIALATQHFSSKSEIVGTLSGALYII